MALRQIDVLSRDERHYDGASLDGDGSGFACPLDGVQSGLATWVRSCEGAEGSCGLENDARRPLEVGREGEGKVIGNKEKGRDW